MTSTALPRLRRALLLVTAITAAACGPGKLADAARTDAPTAHDALDDDAAPAPSCGGAPTYGEPLVIDLPSKQRMDLELAMRKGVPVVRFDCGELQLLQDCSLDGGFEYAGVSLKEDVVVLRNRDEVRANLPISGATIAASLERGNSLQLALAMIGKQSTTLREATPAQLRGQCDGATHFVRAAVVGAFALERASDAAVLAAAEIFGAGVGAASKAGRESTMRDGKLDECRAATPAAAAPPGQCATSIRLELVPVTSKRSEATDESASTRIDPCPSGYKLSAGKCTTEPIAAFACNPNDKPECLAQCEKGNAESCVDAALPDWSAPVADRLPIERSAALLERACTGGAARGCTGLAALDESGAGGKGPDIARATASFEKGCAGGDPEACVTLASRLAHRSPDAKDRWPRDDARATQLFQRACDLGREDSCFLVASRYFKGEGTTKDLPRGVAVMRRGCDGGNAKRCTELGLLLLGAMGGGKEFAAIEDVASGLALLERTCTTLDSHAACLTLASLLSKGTKKLPADEARAKALFDRTCPSQQEPEMCERLGKQLSGG